MPLPKKSTPTGTGGSLAGLETRIVELRLADLVRLDENARFMEKAEFDRLVANLRRDGRLTSVPLVARAGDHALTRRGKENPDLLEVLSGNHRVEAGVAAGIETASCMEIVTPIDAKRKVAIQLAHNAIVGKDDPNKLRALYDALDLDLKLYSGLSDDAFKLDEIDVTALGIGQPEYVEINLSFLPESAETVTRLLAEIERKSTKPLRLAARYDDFNLFFETVISVKEGLNIHNNAAALVRMAELAMERLAEIKAADDGGDAG